MKQFIILLLSLFIYSSAASQSDDVFGKLNLNLPQLQKVKDNYNSGNQKKALKALLELYRSKENLYLKASKADVNHIKTTYPIDVDKTLKTADEVLNHYFIFRDEWDMEKTNIPYQFKGDIDWKAIPNGDLEWCFMLNRHKFWIHLGRAYMLTGNEKYAKGFVKQANHWIENNPLEEDFKKYSWRRIEAGIRIQNWIKAFEYFKNSKHITPEFFSKFLSSINQHATYINSAFSNFSQTSNWGVIEFHGLFNASQFLTEFKEAKLWEKDALNNLNTCINLQILEDGTQWEQSPMYHNEVFHCFMNVNLLAQRNDVKLPEALIKKTKNMAYANIKWQKPNYHQPLLGDSDDTDLRGLLTLSSLLFKDPVLKSRAYTDFDYETFFITGKTNKENYKNIDIQLPNFLSVFQQSSGDFYMRSSWETDATFASLHLKKLGCGHGHDNLLHFTLFANGKDYLIDGGRYSYVDNKWREYFKNNKSHNTLGVDNLTNSVYQDSWTNSFEARSEGVFTKIETTFDYAEAENTAYKRLEDPVSMKRRLLFIKPDVWLVFDSFSANKKHKYSQYFNFPNDSINIKNGGLSTTYKTDNLRIQPIKVAEIILTDSWWSPEYNLKKETKRAEIFKEAEGFSSFITLFYFPSKTNLKYEKIPVYNRNNIALPDSDTEALNLYIDNKRYTVLVVHNSPAPANHFYIVNNQIVTGEVVLIENSKDQNIIRIIKE
tara:strand:- start:29843 stop:31990 length:2148 start_codon:yes stop_codon:yes gene_type:complete